MQTGQRKYWYSLEKDAPGNLSYMSWVIFTHFTQLQLVSLHLQCQPAESFTFINTKHLSHSCILNRLLLLACIVYISYDTCNIEVNSHWWEPWSRRRTTPWWWLLPRCAEDTERCCEALLRARPGCCEGAAGPERRMSLRSSLHPRHSCLLPGKDQPPVDWPVLPGLWRNASPGARQEHRSNVRS